MALALALSLTVAATPITVAFQNGRSPTTAYSGIEEVWIRPGENEPWDAGTNYDGVDLQMDAFPVKKAALIRWRLEGLPSNAVVTSASLSFQVTSPATVPFQVYECLADWTEAEATFNQRRAGQAWAVPGASAPGTDRGATVLADLSSGVNGPLTVSLNGAGVAVVQAWVSGAPNRGFVIQNYSARAADGLDLRCSEAPAASDRPALIIGLSDGSTWRFQEGIAPVAGYAGTFDTTLAHGPAPDGNADGFGLAVGGGFPNHVLIRYDLSAIPAGMRVGAATVGFEVLAPAGEAYPLSRLLRPWVENRASWTTSDGAAPWELAGAVGPGDRDVSGADALRFSAAGASSQPLGDGGVAAVESWINGAAPNHGFLISGNPFSAGRAVLLDSEVPDAGLRPSLVLSLTPDDGGLRLFPARVDAFTGGQVQLQAVGGTPPYRFRLSRSGSGGAVAMDTGGYRAGPVAGDDEVQVTDSAGQSQAGTVRVLCAGQVCAFPIALEMQAEPPGPTFGVGDRVRLRLEAREAADAGEPAPRLVLAIDGGYRIVEARIEGGPGLSAGAGGYALPALGPGQSLRIQIDGRIAAAPGDQVEVTAVVVDGRAEASNRADASWTVTLPQVSTGCGCSSAPGAAVLAVAALAAAAGQRGRRRRREGRAVPISSERSIARAEWVSAPIDT